ncbi:MAG: hypothetical protein RBS16_09605 [Candidatus Cloacimonadales bacterium]|jgi:predicted  nucleic acid-binding Zn-ribbon protein|nr:hypothetical protein [Candidatus Cloacimonadales bacterium]
METIDKTKRNLKNVKEALSTLYDDAETLVKKLETLFNEFVKLTENEDNIDTGEIYNQIKKLENALEVLEDESSISVIRKEIQKLKKRLDSHEDMQGEMQADIDKINTIINDLKRLFKEVKLDRTGMAEELSKMFNSFLR